MPGRRQGRNVGHKPNTKVNKLSSAYSKEDIAAIEERRKASTIPLDVSKLERGEPHFPPECKHLDFPQRPSISTLTKDNIDEVEESHVSAFIASVKAESENVAPFEENVEVWRQLWRVQEKSDVLILVCDIRHPFLTFPFKVLENWKKPAICVLTKTDLVDSHHIKLWKFYFNKVFPQLTLFEFNNKSESTEGLGGVQRRRKVIKKPLTNADKAQKKKKAAEIVDFLTSIPGSTNTYPTAGFIGFPNVGKSSLLNILYGKKVTSVSRSCGHTKHWQTHLIKDSDEKVILELCDCPGLVFPISFADASIARSVFELSGLQPVAQIRETFTAIRFLSLRVDLERLYNFKIDKDNYPEEISAYSLLGSLAEKRGCFTTKSSAPDFHRMGLECVNDVCDGVVLLHFTPPMEFMQKYREEILALVK